MRNPTINKLTIGTTAETIRRSDLKAARVELAFAVGAAVEVSGTVRKIVKRDGESKLTIQPGDVPGFVVFADCPGELKKPRKTKIRKGVVVTVRGKVQTVGATAVCLSDCRTQGNGKETMLQIGITTNSTL